MRLAILVRSQNFVASNYNGIGVKSSDFLITSNFSIPRSMSGRSH